MKANAVAILLVTFFVSTTYSQNVAINSSGAPAHVHAALDIQSLNKGLLIPRIDSAVRVNIAAPPKSLLVFDQTKDSFMYYNGRTWQALGGGGTAGWALTGNTGIVDGTHFMGTTDNVPLSFRVNNQPSGRIDSTWQNTFWGYAAGRASKKDDNRNTAIGYKSLANNSRGHENTAIGAEALYSNEGGMGNVAFGNQSLFKNITGSGNVAVGAGTLFNNTKGRGNVAIGLNTMAQNDSGGLNTAVGYGALSSNISGELNNALGYFALYSNTKGKNNIGIGPYALFSNTEASGNVALGSQALQSNIIGNKNIAIGPTAMIFNSTGSANIAMGEGALLNNRTGGSNIAIGVNALHGAYEKPGASNNLAIGTNALSGIITGTENIAIGNQALQANTTGSRNTAVGVKNLFKATADNNAAFGYQALANDTLGYSNAAFGYQALMFDSTGNENAAFGFQALQYTTDGHRNTGVGSYAAMGNRSGSDNTGVGYRALQGDPNGTYNTAIGVRALLASSGGYGNTGLGTDADIAGNEIKNATALGYWAKVNAPNKVRIGNAAVTQVEVPINVSTIADGRYYTDSVAITDNASLKFIMGLRPLSFRLNARTADENMSSAQYKPIIDGNTTLQNMYTQAGGIYRLGFSGQQVEQLMKLQNYSFPGLNKPRNGGDYYSISYELFVVPLVKAMQEQQAIINNQDAEISFLKTTIDDLRVRLAALEEKVNR